MTVDPDKLREFAATLTDDQTRLLREALAEGDVLHPSSLADTFSSSENQEHFRALAAERDAGVTNGDAGAGDAGAGDAGTHHPPIVEPPLTRW